MSTLDEPWPKQLISVLVTAHLDSINEAGTSASRAPGADDDGSGSAGVIEIARVLKDHQGKHDLQFILFGGEEQGLLGSKAFVASMTAADRASPQEFLCNWASSGILGP
jgi:Predicted aminopeptidases